MPEQRDLEAVLEAVAAGPPASRIEAQELAFAKAWDQLHSSQHLLDAVGQHGFGDGAPLLFIKLAGGVAPVRFSTIPRLFSRRCPATVAGFVVSFTSILSIECFGVGFCPISAKKFSNDFHRSQTVMPRPR